MAHFAIIAPPLAGHINALAALAEALVARDHSVTLLGPADARRWVRGAMEFQPIGSDLYPPGGLSGDEKRMGALNGLFGVPSMIRDLARMTDMVCREAPAALRRIGADAVIADQMEPGGGLVAEALGLPFATVATGLHINRSDKVPPPFVGWRYDPTPHGEWKVRGAYRVSDRMMRPIGDVLEHHCRRFGLQVRRDGAEFLSPLIDIAQAVPSIDYPRDDLPPTFHYTGPLRGARDRNPYPMPLLDRLPKGRPLAFCSFGTLQGSRLSLFRSVAKACARLDVNLVLVHCGRLSDVQARSLERIGHTIVRDFVPQDRVLERADIAILHGGFNTVLDALAVQTPMVVLPLAMEQPAIAARLQRAGLARTVSPLTATAKRISRAMEGVLRDPKIGARLNHTANEIRQAGGAERAADLIQRALAARICEEPVHA